MSEPTKQSAPNAIPVDLPGSLRSQFDALKSRLWKLETSSAVAAGASCLAVSFLGVFVADRVWDSPVWWRGGALLLGMGGVVWNGAGWTKRWLLAPPDTRLLAQRVQKRFRRLGDRLLGIVELADVSRRPAHFSPELYRAAIQQVSADAAGCNFTEAADGGPLRRWLVALATSGATVLALWFLIPDASANAFSRWLAFASEIPRYTLVRIEDLKTPQIVPHGEEFIVTASVRYQTFWKPRLAVAHLKGQPELRSPVRAERIEFRVSGQVMEGALTIRLGDATRTVAVHPLHRPALKSLAASVQYPDYLQRPADTEIVRSGSFSVIEGGSVSFRGQVTRDLEAAAVAKEAGEPQPLRVNGPGFLSEPFNSAGVLEFTWRDSEGLRNSSPWRLNVETRPDVPATADLLDTPREMTILESEVLNLKVQTRDDFGVKDLGVRWARDGDWSAADEVPPLFRSNAPTAQETNLVENFGFSPRLMNVAPDSVLELKVFARDFFPNRAAAESAPYRVHVMGNERHAEMLRLQLESLQARLEEAARLEEKIAAGTEALKELSPQELAEDKQTAPIESLKDEQSANARALEDLAREGARTLREAMRNPLIPEETLSEWTKNLQQMDQLSRQQMKEAQQSLSDAQKQPQSREKELSEALQKEKEALEMLSQMQQNVNKGLDQLQALTLAQRLRKLGSGEKNLEARLQKHVGDSIGLLPAELPARIQKINTGVAEEQKAIQTDTTSLQNEISRFFERTQRAEYGKVSGEMTESKAAEELLRLGELVRENIAMQAMQHLASWSGRFSAWADVLEPKSKGGSGAAGGGAGGQGADDGMAERLMKTLLGLLRLREDEMTLREQTRLLDQRKEEGPIYFFHTDALAGDERESIVELDRIQRINPLAMLNPVMGETFDSMKSAMTLLAEPKTGDETRGTQTKSINLLTDGINLINEQAKKQQEESGSSSSQEIAFLMQMMSEGQGEQPGTLPPGRSPGGNRSGGSTDRPATAAAGEAAGKAASERNVRKATGFSGNVPTEFREALQNYFNALEKSGEAK